MALGRPLTASETALFLSKHPVTAARVAETKVAMLSGFYDFDYYDHINTTLLFPGVIEPRGLQIEDGTYGLVTIQPAPGGIFFTGWSEVMGDAEKENHVSIPAEGNIAEDIKHGLLVAGLVVGVGFALASKRK